MKFVLILRAGCKRWRFSSVYDFFKQSIYLVFTNHASIAFSMVGTKVQRFHRTTTTYFYENPVRKIVTKDTRRSFDYSIIYHTFLIVLLGTSSFSFFIFFYADEKKMAKDNDVVAAGRPVEGKHFPRGWFLILSAGGNVAWELSSSNLYMRGSQCYLC